MELPIWDSRVPTPQGVYHSRRNRPVRKMRPISLENCDDILCFLGDFGVLVCKQHSTGVVNLDRHLLEQHATPAKVRKKIIQRFSQLERVDPKAIELPEQPACLIKELGTPLDGLQCKTCPFLTVNEDAMRRHLKNNHQQVWTEEKSALFHSVKVQTFFRGGGLQKYFIVDLGVKGKDEKLRNDQVAQQQLSAWQQVRQQLEDEIQVMEEATKTDKTGWYERTGWLPFLEGRNLAHLGYQTRLPDRNEAKLQLAAKLTEELIERAVRGLATLPWETRRWLRSARQAEADQRPLARLQNPESQATYASYMVRFVCFYLRVVADEEGWVDGHVSPKNQAVDSASDEDVSTDSEYNDDGREEAGDSNDEDSSMPQRRQRSTGETGKMKDARELFTWRDNQKALARQLWLSLSYSDAAAQTSALLDSLASFILTSYGSNELSSGLMQYLAVLGIDTQTNRLRTAKNYSSILAGMVYCVRVLAVEKILPAAERDDQTKEDHDRFLAMRKKYLADGSFSPMSAMISLLAYSKHIAINEGNAGHAYWSPDKTTFYSHGQLVVVEQFRKMAQGMEAELEEQFWQLCWVEDTSERFAIDLGQIQDDITFTTRGKSFVTTAGNNLCGGLEWMLKRACNTEGGMRMQTSDGEWRSKKVREYLRQMDCFLELLLGCVHVESGQPVRGSEILTMRHCNGLLQDRNVFVVAGAIMIVARYHNCQSQWDKPRVVARFLPPRLGQIMALYLSYLQPFREFLSSIPTQYAKRNYG